MSLAEKKIIVSAQAAWPNISKVISMCGLKCCGHWKLWSDCEGNLLKHDGDKFNIVLNRRPINTSNDIYRFSPPENIISKSNWSMKIGSNVLCLLGDDDLLRCCYFEDDVWIKNFVPLRLGIELLDFACEEYLNSENKATRKEVAIHTVKVSGVVEIVTQSIKKEL